MKYYVQTVKSAGEIKNAKLIEITNYHPDHATGPKTTVQVVYVKDQGFRCRLTCWEKDPKAVETRIDGNVYLDSCMEWFVKFNPTETDEYLNFESNAFGALHCMLGAGRHGRRAIPAEVARPTATITMAEDHWIVDYDITLETIQALFGKASYQPGDILKCNFYKCGDETAVPHFGMWNHIPYELLDFHTPQYFGELEIVD